MKIILICGSLVQGKDGVGDYCRRLAGEMIRQGHEAALIAINKPTVGSEESFQLDEGTIIPTLRLSKEISWRERVKAAKQFIKGFDPDWLSFQVSPYAYHVKGFPLYLPFRLRVIGDHRKWHIMVHEPFLRKGDLNIKEEIVRRLQILNLQSFKPILHPSLWTTSIPIYKQMVEQELHIQCKLLGLFGNIPLNSSKKEVVNNEDENPEYLTAIYFGSAPAPKDAPLLLERIKEQLPVLKKRLHLIFCGKMSHRGEGFTGMLKQIVEENNGKVSFKGELPSGQISNLFSIADFGISRVSPLFLGKSGVVATMLEHGLPIWVPLANSNEEIQQNTSFRNNLFFNHISDINVKQREGKQAQLPMVAAMLLKEYAARK